MSKTAIATVGCILVVLLAATSSVVLSSRSHARDQEVLRAAAGLVSPQAEVRLSASNQVAQLGAGAVERLARIVQQNGTAFAKLALALDRRFPTRFSARLIRFTHARDLFQNQVTAATALGVLRVTDPHAVTALCRAMDHGQDELSSAAATALAQMGPASVYCLTNALYSPHAWTRSMAAYALAVMPNSPNAATPHLITRLSDPALQISGQAAYALSRIGRDAVPSLARALQSTNQIVRERAIQCLRLLGAMAYSALPEMTRALSDSSSTVRAQAAGALAVFGPHAKLALPALQAALADPSMEVRQEAENALAKISPPQSARPGGAVKTNVK